MTSLLEIAWRILCAWADPVADKKSIQAEVSAISTGVPVGKPVGAHRFEIAVPTDSFHGQLLFNGHRSAAQQALQGEMYRLALGAKSERLHGALNELIVDIDVRAAHDTIIHFNVYNST